MVQVSTRLWKAERQRWFAAPSSSHLVHIYQYDRILIAGLLEYVAAGLWRRETCLVIATPLVLIGLQKALRNRGVDVASALQTGRYIAYDADELLQRIMNGNGRSVDKAAFFHEVGAMVGTRRSLSMRVCGDLAARVVSNHSLEAAIDLEECWGGLLKESRFSLYCAYSSAALHVNAHDRLRNDTVFTLHTDRICC